MEAREFFPIGNEYEQEEYAVALKLDVIDLGPNNIGSYGPDNLDETVAEKAMQDTALPEYSRPLSSSWICVDGRCSQEEIDAELAGDNKEAAGQTAGSLPVSESVSDLMADPYSARPLSQRVAENTRQQVADGCKPIMHGDEKAGKAGCKANADMRQVLRFNAENSDIVAPKVWAVMGAIGAEQHLHVNDVITDINAGKIAADKDELWDVSPEELVDIAVANGAGYQVYKDSHAEAGTRVDTTERGFAKARYVLDHTADGQTIQMFSATIGAYYREALRRAKLNGLTEQDAARKTLRVALFNVGIDKMLTTDKARVGLISAQQ